MKRWYLSIILLLVLAIPINTTAFNLDFDKLVEITKKLKKLKPVSEKGEKKLGKDVAAKILGASSLVKDRALQKYVNEVGMWIALHTDRPKLAWRFGVLDTSSINAFSTPGGYVFITRGLLLTMRDEAELAGVLAHEVSHTMKKHVLKTMKKGALVGLAGDIYKESVNGDDNETINKIVDASTEIFTRGLDKGDEYAADRYAAVIAARAGYDPFGLAAVLQTLASINPKDDAVSLMFKTHPDPEKRLEKMMAAIGDRLDKYGEQQRGSERFSAAMKAHIEFYQKSL